jgi:hypothetical protein
VTSRGPLVRHPLFLVGVAITTAAAVGFLTMTAAAALGLFRNPYAGIVVFVALPALFLLGLLLIPLGIWRERKALLKDPTAVPEWPVVDLRKARVRRVTFVVGLLTAVNVMIVLLAGYGTLHWMESPSFCGETCHTPMHPQFTAWQNAPHSGVACVQCHVGEGARSLVKYKLAGARMLLHVATGNYPRPIPASIVDLRPAIETCGNCHNPTISLGQRAHIVRDYADDEANSETITELQMHVGGPGQPTAVGRAIHWHADPSIRVEYIATDPDRQTIPFVKVTNAKGEVKEFVLPGTTPAALEQGQLRVMDCTDCHNMAVHRIAPTAEQAVDRAIAAGQISRALPFVRRESVRLAKTEHADEAAALAAIDAGLRQFYTSEGKKADEASLAHSIRGLQAVYRRNVFPTMKVTFGVYKDNLGHTTSDGCFRCHDESHVAKDGTAISADCSYCHEQREAQSQ